jgi:RNA polymerase sigma factor (sigma-70 family)
MVNEDLVIAHMPNARLIANMFRRRAGDHIDIDELVSIAYMALVEVAPRFDPSNGVKFWTFAERRITGALYDSLRKRIGRETPRFFVTLSKKRASVERFEHRVEAKLTVRRAIRTVLPPQSISRRIIELTADGYDPGEIRAQLGIANRNNYSVARYYAIQRMREALA